MTAPIFSTFCCPTGRVKIFRRDDRGTPSQLADDVWEVAGVLNADRSLCCFVGPVAIDDGVIVVGGAYPESDPDTDHGRAFIFERNGDEWFGAQTITPSESAPRDKFGAAVAFSGADLMIGAPNTFINGGTGLVYVFQHEGGAWIEKSKITPSDLRPGDAFGASLALTSTLLVVGAPNRNDPRLESGVAFVFENRDGDWIEVSKLVSWGEVEPYPHFGTRVAIHDDVIVVGAFSHPWAYLFRKNAGAWWQISTLAGLQDRETPLMVTDGRVAFVRNYIYAVGLPFDVSDFAVFQNCAACGAEPLGMDCIRFDFEKDGMIDARDLPLFLLTFIGPERGEVMEKHKEDCHEDLRE